MKIALVTGGRNYPSKYVVWHALSEELRTWNGKGKFVVVHGCARGADSFAQEWVDEMRAHQDGRVYAAAFPADWDAGSVAGHQRNAWMHYYLDQYIKAEEVILVFHEFATLDELLAQYKGGTRGMVKRMMEHGTRELSDFKYHNPQGRVT